MGKNMPEDGFYYTICVSTRLLVLRRRFFPKTLRYETRWSPPIKFVEHWPEFARRHGSRPVAEEA